MASARRHDRLAADLHNRVLTEVERRWSELLVVDLSDAISYRAAELVELHPLSGMDALQLATAVELRASLGARLYLATWDRRLWQAARAEGFDVLPKSAP